MSDEIVASLRTTVLGLVLLATPLGAQQGRVQVGSRVTPDTVTVGDPFVVILRVRAPAGATVDFPPPPDTSGPIQPLDPVSIRDTIIGTVTEYTALYRLAAWDIGVLPISLPELLVRLAGDERRVSLSELRVTVKTVLPADTTLHVPKPARAPLDVPVSNWWKWLAALLTALILLALFWWWRRWRRRPRVAPVVDPMKAAEEEFARVESLGLLDAGERGRYVALMVDVVRDYLARRVATPSSMTSTELLAALRRKGKVPLGTLAPLLTEADLVKFARYQIGADRAKHLAAEARQAVKQAHDATIPTPDPATPSAKERAA